MKCLFCVQYWIAEEVQRKRQNLNPEGVCVLIQEHNIPKKRGLKTAHDPKELIISFSILDTLTWKDSNMGSQMIFCQGK